MVNKRIGIDLTKLVEKGELDALAAWREKEIELVMQILCKRRRNNPCLLGNPGSIGVKSVIEGLAQRIANGSAPLRFQGKKVISLKKGHLLAGNESLAHFDQRLKELLDEVKQTDHEMVIFVVDEVDVLKRLGPIIDQCNCIGSLSRNEYQKHIENDSILREYFQPMDLPEPSFEEIIKLLKVLRVRYEAHHNVIYDEEALTAAAELSTQCYISSNGVLIDKALDVIDEAGARVSLQITGSNSEKKGRVVTKKHIEELISLSNRLSSPIKPFKVGRPDSRLKTKSKGLSDMEETFRKHIIGQEEAVEAISRALLRARVGIRDTRRPIASFLFIGPTGVGKTELANAVAIEYFGSMDSMKRFDMSEYMEKHAVSKLIGSPPGYVGFNDGGQLTNAIQQQPKSVVLFDEIEKAHKDVYDTLLQLLEDGRLTDGKGNTVDFTNTVIILTSNIGHNLFCGGQEEGDCQILKRKVLEELKKYFRLEILNRLDDVLVFRQLNQDELRKILDIMLNKFYERMINCKNIVVKVRDNVKNKLIEEGFDPTFGARPLRRYITRLLEDALAQWIVDGDVKEGDSIELGLGIHGDLIKHTTTQEDKKRKLELSSEIPC